MNWNPSATIPLLIGLFLFGVLYALAVYRMGDKAKGYTSLLVVVGVIVTIATSGLVIGWYNVMWLGIAFAAAGIPMIVGDAIKAINERAAREEAQIKLLQRFADMGVSEASEVIEHETPSVR